MKKPMLSIGVSDFGKLIRFKNAEGTPYTYVDKTLFIKDIVCVLGDEITLITRPKRLGKTLILTFKSHYIKI